MGDNGFGAEGINGTCGGRSQDIAKYMAAFREVPSLADVPFQRSTWVGEGTPFPMWWVKEVNEIISLGVEGCCADEGAQHLLPREFHAALGDIGRDDLLLDCRNGYESTVGRFFCPNGAQTLCPDTRKFTDFPAWVDENLDALRGAKRVLMYCT